MSDESSFILRLIDKVTGPARKMQGSLGGVQAKFDGLKTSLGRTNAALSTTTSALRNVGSAAASTGGILHNALGVSVGNAISGAASDVAGLGATMVKATANAVMFGQESELAFGMLAKHGASATKLYDHARGLAEKYGMSVQGTVNNFRELLAQQFNPKMATDVIKMASDMRVLGADAEKTQGIITAMSQIKAKGSFQMEEARQLNERGISLELINQEIAKRMNIGVSDVAKKIEAGGVNAMVALDSIMGAVKTKLGEKNLGDAGERFADNTLRGMFGKLAAKAENRLLDIGKEIEPFVTQAFKPLRDKMSAILDNPKLKSGIANALIMVADAAKAALPWVERIGGIALKTFQSFGQGFLGKVDVGARLQELGGKFETFLAKIGSPEMQAVFGRMGERLGMAIDFAAKLAGALLALIPVAMQVADAVQRPINAVLGVLLPLAGKFVEIGSQLVGGLVSGIISAIGGAVAAVGELGTSVIVKLKGVLGIRSPSREFMHLGEMSGLGFVEGLQSSLAANDTKVGDLTPSVLSQGPTLPSFSGSGPQTLAGAGGGTFTVQNHFEFNITQQPGQSGEELARDIGAAVRREVTSVFEQMAIEAA